MQQMFNLYANSAILDVTRCSAIADGLRGTICYLKSCQMLHN